MELIKCTNLCKNYGNIEALKNINLKIGKGKIIGLLGTNGSGKTTLIKIINNLLMQTSGEILIDGKKPGIDSKIKISYLPERTYLPSENRVEEVVNYFKDFYNNFDKETAYRLLEILKIDPKVKLKELSKGNKEKVQLVLVMSRKADIYILDEPIGGVDPIARDHILDLIINNFEENSTIILSTHLIADIEKILDDVIFIKDGEIILTSSADELRNKYGTSIENVFKEVLKQC